VARDATARLYDVDADSLVFKKFSQSEKYDIGTVTFRAKPGRLVDLDKLHESVWATRLSGGTRSGLVSLEVTATGSVISTESDLTLQVAGSNASFVLARNTEEEHKKAFDELRAALDRGDKLVSVSGRLDGWAGRWPDMLQKLPPKPRRMLVTGFETASDK
jgi:hypothetical protein